MFTPVSSTSSVPRNDLMSLSRAQSTPNNEPKYNSLLEMQTELTRPTTAGMNMHKTNIKINLTNVNSSHKSCIDNTNKANNATITSVNGGSVNKEGKSNIFVAVRVRPLHVHHSRECITTTIKTKDKKNKVDNKETIVAGNLAKQNNKPSPEMSNENKLNEESISSKTNKGSEQLNDEEKSDNINNKVNERYRDSSKGSRTLQTSPSPHSSTTSTSSITNISESSVESSHERCVHILANNVIECNIPAQESINTVYNGELYTKNNTANNANTTNTTSTITSVNTNSSNSGRFTSACDVVFDEQTSQTEIMNTIGSPAVDRVMEGYNGTILCYGQSGSGKTYTMIGPEGGDERALRVEHRHRTVHSCEKSNSTSANHDFPDQWEQLCNKQQYHQEQEQEREVNNTYKNDKLNKLQPRIAKELITNTSITQKENAIKHEITNGNKNEIDDVDNNLEYSVPAETGLLTRILLRLLNRLHHDEQTGRNKAWSLTLSAVELYNEQLRDLLPEETVRMALTKYKRERAQVEQKHTMSSLRNASKNVKQCTQTVSRQASACSHLPCAKELYLTESEEEQLEYEYECERPSSNYNNSKNNRELSPEPVNYTLDKNNKSDCVCELPEHATSEVYSVDDSRLEVSLSTLGNTERMMMTTTGMSSDEIVSPITTTGTTNTIASNVTITVNMSAPSSCDIHENTYNDDNNNNNNFKEPFSFSSLISNDKAEGENKSATHAKNKKIANNNKMSHQCYKNNNLMGKSILSQFSPFLPPTPLPSAAKNSNTANNVNESTNGDKEKSSNRSNLPWNQRGKLNRQKGKQIALSSLSPSPSSGQRVASRANSISSFATSTGINGKNNNNNINNNNNNSVPRCSNLFIRTRPNEGIAPNNTSNKNKEKQSKPNFYVSSSIVNNSSSVFVQGLSKHSVHNIDEALDLLHVALLERHMGVTQLNVNSNRAHTLFFVEVEQVTKTHTSSHATVNEPKDNHNVENTEKSRTRTSDHVNEINNIDCKEKIRKSHRKNTSTHVTKSLLTLVDLAGSERVSHTGAEGIRLKEAQKINCSLMLLANVIRRLNTINKNISSVQSSVHIPYRDSKLTWLLRDSFGGNTITFVLCNISAHVRNARETISTLRFATSMKLVFNIPVINTVSAHLSSRAVAALQKRLQEAQDYIQRLEAQIKAQDEEGNTPQSTDMMIEHEPQAKNYYTLHESSDKKDKESRIQSTAAHTENNGSINAIDNNKSQANSEKKEVDPNDHSRSTSDHFLQEELETVKEAHMQTAHELQTMKEKMANLMNSLAARERELNELKSKSSDNSARTSHSNTPSLVQLCKVNNSYSVNQSHPLPPCPSSASQVPLITTTSSTEKGGEGKRINTNSSIMSPSSSLFSFVSPQLSSTVSLLPSTSESNFTRRYSRHVIPIIYRRPSFISVRSTNVSEPNSSANSCVSGYKYVPVFAPEHSHQGTTEQNERAYQQIHKNNTLKSDRFNNEKDIDSNNINKNVVNNGNDKSCASSINNTIIIKANEDAIVQPVNKNKNNKNNSYDEPIGDAINDEEPHVLKTHELCNDSTSTSSESTSNEDGIHNNFEEVKMLEVRSQDNDARSRLWQR